MLTHGKLTHADEGRDFALQQVVQGGRRAGAGALHMCSYSTQGVRHYRSRGMGSNPRRAHAWAALPAGHAAEPGGRRAGAGALHMCSYSTQGVRHCRTRGMGSDPRGAHAWAALPAGRAAEP